MIPSCSTQCPEHTENQANIQSRYLVRDQTECIHVYLAFNDQFRSSFSMLRAGLNLPCSIQREADGVARQMTYNVPDESNPDFDNMYTD